MAQEADLVLTAEAAHRGFILEDNSGAFRKVITLGQFVEAAAAAGGPTGRDLLLEIGQRRGSADLDLDVADPYGRGREAAREAAKTLIPRLRAVLTALVG